MRATQCRTAQWMLAGPTVQIISAVEGACRLENFRMQPFVGGPVYRRTDVLNGR